MLLRHYNPRTPYPGKDFWLEPLPLNNSRNWNDTIQRVYIDSITLTGSTSAS